MLVYQRVFGITMETAPALQSLRVTDSHRAPVPCKVTTSQGTSMRGAALLDNLSPSMRSYLRNRAGNQVFQRKIAEPKGCCHRKPPSFLCLLIMEILSIRYPSSNHRCRDPRNSRPRLFSPTLKTQGMENFLRPKNMKWVFHVFFNCTSHQGLILSGEATC